MKSNAPEIVNGACGYCGAIVEGSEDITEHELATLRHVPDRLPYTAWLIVVVELAERCVSSLNADTLSP